MCNGAIRNWHGRRISVFLLCVLCVFVVIYALFFHRLADRDLWSSHEARAAMDAQTILDDGDWKLPHLYDGRAELQKPPLYYWLVALIARARGGVVDAYSVRLPSTLSAIGCVAVVFWLAWRRKRMMAGIIAATVLATAIHFTWLARVGRIDMPLTLAVSVSLALFYLRIVSFSGRPRGDARRLCASSSEALNPTASRRGRPLNRNAFLLVVAYLSLAAGLLLKGPIAVVLPFAALGLFLLLEGNLRRPFHWLHCLGLWWGLPLALGIAALWFIWANRATGNELFQTFFVHHNIERALGENIVDRWSHPWWLYGPLFMANVLPWSLVVPVAGWIIWRKGWWREDPELRFATIWFAAIFGTLSCVSFKRADYLLPAYPGVALLLGCVGERLYTSAVNRRTLAWGFAVTGCGCVLGWIVFLNGVMPGKDRQLEYQTFAEEIRQFCPRPEPLCFFRTESHPLAFHVGRPLDIFVEWEKLTERAARAKPQYIVMPLARFEECPEHVPADRLEKLLTSSHVKPLVLVRTRTAPAAATADESADAGTAATAADCHAAAQRRLAGSERPAGP
jgi:4-amino-4-deoxy-L-arabinose transferase-like glycosyltransferase